jgi:hypothetical protein
MHGTPGQHRAVPSKQYLTQGRAERGRDQCSSVFVRMEKIPRKRRQTSP